MNSPAIFNSLLYRNTLFQPTGENNPFLYRTFRELKNMPENEEAFSFFFY